MKSNTLTAKDGAQIVYATYGPDDGTPLMLVHGLGGDHEMWAPQIETYPSYGYRLIVPDMRGHGESAKVETLELSDWVSDLVEILDHEGIETTHMAGVSMGGVIAQSFAVAHQNRLRRLVLSDTFHELRKLQHKMIGGLAVFMFRLYKLFGIDALIKGMASSYESETVGHYFQTAMQHTNLDQMVLARKAVNTVDLADALSTLETPTLVVVGVDFGMHFVKISRSLAECLPHAELVELSGAKDPSNLVNPAGFDEVVLPFLAATEDPQTPR